MSMRIANEKENILGASRVAREEPEIPLCIRGVVGVAPDVLTKHEA